MERADPSGLKLDADDAAVVKGMLERGDRQHDIAAWFGVNAGRIAEIKTQKLFRAVKARENDLPPPGPYVRGKISSEAISELNHIKTTLSHLIKRIDSIMSEI